MAKPNSTQNEFSPSEKRTRKQRFGGFFEEVGAITGLVGIALFLAWLWGFSQGCNILSGSTHYTGPDWVPLVRAIVITVVGLVIIQLGVWLKKSRK